MTTAALTILLAASRRVELEMRRQKFKVILISNDRSKNFRSQFALTTTNDDINFKQGSNSSSIQLVHGVKWFQFIDSKDLTENYPAGNFDSKKIQFRMDHPLIPRKWRHTTDVSWMDGSHHVTSKPANIRCRINLCRITTIWKPGPKLANQFAESLESWKQRATVKSSQHNIHVAWIMFSFALVIIKTDRIKWTYLPRLSD